MMTNQAKFTDRRTVCWVKFSQKVCMFLYTGTTAYRYRGGGGGLDKVSFLVLGFQVQPPAHWGKSSHV